MNNVVDFDAYNSKRQKALSPEIRDVIDTFQWTELDTTSLVFGEDGRLEIKTLVLDE